jgi:hypothetical protein
MVVLLEGSPIYTEELCSSVGFLVTSLTKALLPRFQLRMMEATVVLGTVNAADIL